MALTSKLGFLEGCDCESCKPDVAKFAERLDAVGGSDKARITFTSTVAIPHRPEDRDALYEWKPEPLPLESTKAEARVYDVGSRPRGAPPIDVVFATHTITEKAFSIVTLVRNAHPALLPDEVEAIVSDMTRRFDAMLRSAIYGGDPK